MIILTGSKGFIGQNFKKVLGNVIEVEQDNCFDFLNNFDQWEDVEMIIHQGAISSTTETDIRKIYKYNVEFTLSLFEKAIQYQIPVKYASSASVYGLEESIFNPLNQYAISKLQIDYWVLDNLSKFPLIQGFRYFNVYGKGEDHKGDQSSPVSKFLKQIKETNQVKVFEGSENMLRDFIWVGDLIDIVLNNDKGSGIYDLGTSNPISFLDVANAVVNSNGGGEIIEVPFPNHLVGKYQDYTKAKKEWGEYNFHTVEGYLF
jgi:ADP-L-glycero-D-manno-heptose 6-epimerase